MIKKILLISISLAVAFACTACAFLSDGDIADTTEPSADVTVDDTVDSDDTADTDDIADTTDTADTTTDDDTDNDIKTDIVLDFAPYTFVPGELTLPSDEEYKSVETNIQGFSSIFGRKTQRKMLTYVLNYGGIIERYITCTDMNTGEVFFEGKNAYIFDFDSDGDHEIFVDGKLLKNTDEGIMVADVNAAFENYLDAIIEKNVEYTYSVSFDSTHNCVIFGYTLYYRNAENYEAHLFESQYTDGGFGFVCEYEYIRDSGVKYESNTPDWRVETVKSEVVNEELDYSHNLYAIKLYGPNGEEYSLYERFHFPEGLYDAVSGGAITGENSLGFGEYEDARFDRKLIVHPSYDYALLVFPASRETSADAARTEIQLINLKTGKIVETPSATSALYATYNDWREGMFEINEYNEALGYSLRTITEDVEITDTGFHIRANLNEWNGDVMRSAEFDIDLKELSDGFDPTYGLEFSFVRNGGMFYLIFGDNGEITVPDTETELYALVIDGSFVPMLPEKGGEGILVPKAAFDEMKIDIENDAEHLTLDEILEMGYKVDTVCMDANSVLNYELNAIVIETSNIEARYTVDKAQSIVYDKLRAGYDDLLAKIVSGELSETHSEGSIARITADAASFTVSSVRFSKDFGRYYVFTTSAFGAKIYFDRYTGEIFSDAPVIEMATIDISRGLYDLSRAYW